MEDLPCCTKFALTASRKISSGQDTDVEPLQNATAWKCSCWSKSMAVCNLYSIPQGMTSTFQGIETAAMTARDCACRSRHSMCAMTILLLHGGRHCNRRRRCCPAPFITEQLWHGKQLLPPPSPAFHSYPILMFSRLPKKHSYLKSEDPYPGNDNFYKP